MTAGMTFFLSSGLPFLTLARNISPTEPAGKRFSLAPMPVHAIMYKFLAPVLSAQFMTEATGKQFEIFSLIPLRPPLPTQSRNTGLNNVHSPTLPVAWPFYLSLIAYLFYSLIDSVY
jgi:hypothetical protein